MPSRLEIRCIPFAAAAMLLLVLACQVGSEHNTKSDNFALAQAQRGTVLDTDQIIDDFRRLREGCALTITDSREPPEITLAMVLSEFSQEGEAAFLRTFGATAISTLAQRVSISQFCSRTV